MKTNEQARAEYEEAKEQLILRMYLFWYGLRAGFWSAIPHRHVFETKAICERCYRHMSDLFR